MSWRRVWSILRKDLKAGPRGPWFLFAVALPVGLTLVLQLAFGSLFAPVPRLGIVDEGRSAITSSIQQMGGVKVITVRDAAVLRRMVEAHDVDVGLILPVGFDDAVRAGNKPLLEFYVSGLSLASHRIILTVTMLDSVRELTGTPAPVEVRTIRLGEEGLPISVRLVPVVMFYAVVMAGVWIPASSLVEERERRTLAAILVTPAKRCEVLAAKWMLGVILASALAVVTLALNRALGPHPVHVGVVIIMAAVLTSTLGLLAGLMCRSVTELFTLLKGAGLFLFAPVAFYIFPNWPQWIARLFPLYWIIEPVWRVSVMGGKAQQVWLELSVAAVLSASLASAVVRLSRYLES